MNFCDLIKFDTYTVDQIEPIFHCSTSHIHLSHYIKPFLKLRDVILADKKNKDNIKIPNLKFT